MAGYLIAHTRVVGNDGTEQVINGEAGVKVPSDSVWLTVGEVEKLTGVSVTTLRHYDKIGLLSPARAGEGKANNRKLYSADDLGRLQAILTLVEYQFSLGEIKTILDSEDADIYEVISAKLAELRRQMNKLRSLDLFARFVDLTDTDLIEGLAVGPSDIDMLADIARNTPPYDAALERLFAYTDEEAAEGLALVKGAVGNLMALDEAKGFAAVEFSVDAFFTWWSSFVVPYEEIGYLGFWAIFEDQSLVPAYVEEIGAAGDAATVEMCAFFTMMVRLVAAHGARIAEVARLAEGDVVAAIETAEVLRDAIVQAQLGSVIVQYATPEEVEEVCAATLIYLARILESPELVDYFGLEGVLDCTTDEVARTLKVFEVM